MWLGRGGGGGKKEGNEVTPLTCHPGTAVGLHLHYAARSHPLCRICTPRVAGSQPGKWEGMQTRRPRLEGALRERRSSRSHGGQAAAPAGTRSPNPCPPVPFEGFVLEKPGKPRLPLSYREAVGSLGAVAPLRETLLGWRRRNPG